jgi:hypothetical protein
MPSIKFEGDGSLRRAMLAWCAGAHAVGGAYLPDELADMARGWVDWFDPSHDEIADIVNEAHRRATWTAGSGAVTPRMADLIHPGGNERWRLSWHTSNSLTLASKWNPSTSDYDTYELSFSGHADNERWRAVRAAVTDTNTNTNAAAGGMPTMADAATALVAQQALHTVGRALVDAVLARVDPPTWWTRITGHQRTRAVLRWVDTDLGRQAVTLLGAATVWAVVSHGPGTRIPGAARLRRLADAAVRIDALVLARSVLASGLGAQLVASVTALVTTSAPVLAALADHGEEQATIGQRVRAARAPAKLADRW